MEASHLSSTWSRDNGVLQSISTNAGKCLLLAIGIIILVGSIIAAICLYARLGYLSFAIEGTGLVLGVLCFLSSICCNKDTISNRANLKYSQIESNDSSSRRVVTHVIGQNMHASTDSILNRLPCKHEGNSCFVNSALQIMAHLTDFRNLFDNDHHKLEKNGQEEDSCLSRRQEVQKIGKELIDCILDGKQVKGLRRFIDTVNNALVAMGCRNGGQQLLKFDIQAGDDAKLLISSVESILIPDGLVYGFPSSYLNKLDQISKVLSQEEELPTTLVFDNEKSCPYRSEIVINNVGTYQLAALRISTGKHTIPILCSQSGQYFKLDDVVGRAEEISEDELSHILTHNKQSPSAYYIK